LIIIGWGKAYKRGGKGGGKKVRNTARRESQKEKNSHVIQLGKPLIRVDEFLGGPGRKEKKGGEKARIELVWEFEGKKGRTTSQES